jgi:hypothetical protein
MTDFQLNKTYNFVTKAPAILGATIHKAKLVSIENADTARKTSNIDLMYRRIYPLLPNGTPDNVDSCIYYAFIGESGERIVLADQWINLNSVEIVDHITIKITIANANVTDISRVRDSLNSLGFRAFSIE